jgi:hypothetical protein
MDLLFVFAFIILPFFVLLFIYFALDGKDSDDDDDTTNAEQNTIEFQAMAEKSITESYRRIQTISEEYKIPAADISQQTPSEEPLPQTETESVTLGTSAVTTTEKRKRKPRTKKSQTPKT